MEQRKEDIFNEAENELNVLSRKPVSFIIFGKPGCGKTTLAKRLSSVWKCQLVNEIRAIEELVKEKSPLAKQAIQILSEGHELDDDFVAEVISHKLESPEIQHYGYVLDCLPSSDSKWKSVEEQLQFVKDLNQSPDIIINLKIPDVDLLKRRIGQKVDPITNEVFIKSSYDPNYTSSDKPGEEGAKNNENDDEQEENDEEEEEEKVADDEDIGDDDFAEDLGEVDELQLLAPDIANRLVERSNDKALAVEREIKYYKQQMLRPIEDFIIQHNRQYVIELDANLPPKELFHSLLVYLTTLGLPRAVAPKRLIIPEDGDEEDEANDFETDQLLNQLSSTGVLDANFRWRRSKWSKYCPVELAKGNIVQGRTEFTVGLLDKMYCLSSVQALDMFYRSPRKYLLPPNPRVPCKLCILGPPTSGKSSLAKSLAEHFNAMVLDVESLVGPVMQRVQNKALTDAQEKIKEELLNKLIHEREIQNETIESEENKLPPVTEGHPEIQEALAKLEVQQVEMSPDLYIEALTEGIKVAEEARQDSDDGRKNGGWILDGFPPTRNHWSHMIDANLLPDAVISLESNTRDKKVILKRFCESQNLKDSSLWEEEEDKKKKEDKDKDQPVKPKVQLPPVVDNWHKQYTEYNHQFGMLSDAIKGSGIEPIVIDYSLPADEVTEKTICGINSFFNMPTVELDDEAEVDDDPVDEEDAEEEDDENALKKRKPWGDTSYYCPVALKDQEVLWPGNVDSAIRYKERLYAFSTDEAREKFCNNPKDFIAGEAPIKPPPPRILLLGARGSGKTTVGRKLAEETGIFHISFHHYLQEIIMPKMKKPPLVDPDDFESDTDQEDNDDEESSKNDKTDLDEDVAEVLTDRENEIRSYLLQGEQLQEELLDELLSPFWNSEPYKSAGFILEGFPTQSDELRYACSKGFFPDVVATLETEEDHITSRLMPNKMDIWRRKRDKKTTARNDERQKVLREWEEDKAKRRAAIEEDYREKKAEREAELRNEEGSDAEEEEDEEQQDPFLDDYQEQIAELEAEEPPEEEEFDDEAEEDFEERTLTSLRDKHEEQTESINAIKEVLAELQIPYHSVMAGRKIPIVLYCFRKAVSQFLFSRDGLLTKCCIVNKAVAKKLLDHGYKQLSKFGYWCPVKLVQEPQSVLPPSFSSSGLVPVIHRERIYFLSSKEAHGEFETNPGKFLRQEVPSLPVPVRVAIVGPPKSGKTTVANRFCKEFGCLRLSMGEALRKVLSEFPNSDLTSQILLHLKKGQSLPEELCVLALERVLLDVQCTTRGYVFDGWPMTKSQVNLLNKYRIIPVVMIELNVSNEELLKRAERDRDSANRQYVMHDSPSILMTKSGAYHKHLQSIKDWYSHQHDNWYTVNGELNHWKVWLECRNVALRSTVQIQQYLIQASQNNAASIFNLCITPKDFNQRLGKFEHYCPVCFNDNAELMDCSKQDNLEYAVEYQGFYYRTCCEDHMKQLLAYPEEYVGETSTNILPPSDQLPKRLSEAEVKERFPMHYELKGFCPVTYIEGNKRFECLIPGLPKYSLEYKGKLYCCASEKYLDLFMRFPQRYDQVVLPVKLPPLKQPLNIPTLPMLGYMEQTVAVCIINSLTAVGCFKPKFPFLSASQSAQLYVALHLKAYNGNSSRYTREKFRKRLQKFEKQCHLISYLMGAMKSGVINPHRRTDEFENNMTLFMALSN